MKNYKKEGGHMAKVKKVSNTDKVQATIKQLVRQLLRSY